MDEEESIPAHLVELLHPTASGTAKLLAAWDRLAVETKLQLWGHLASRGHPSHLREQIQERALHDTNAYVRYLAARELEAEDRAKEVHSRTADDPSELVRYAHLESEDAEFMEPVDEPDSFFALPQSARLALVRRIREGGEELAAILLHGVRELLPAGQLSEVELADIAQEYVQSAFVRHRDPSHLPSDGYAAFSDRCGVEAMWECVAELPERVASPLVRHLPEGYAGSQIPQEALDALPSRLFTTLLFRTDIDLFERRKTLALDATQSHAWNIAAAVNLRLTDEELDAILVSPAEINEGTAGAEPTQENVAGRLRLLRRLAGQPGLTPVQQLATADVLRAMPVIGPVHSLGEDGDLAGLSYERTIRQAAADGRTAELDRVRVYRAAQLVSDWGCDEVGRLPASLRSFDITVEPGNPWVTYMRLRAKGAAARSDITRTLRAEVWLDEIGEEPPDALDE